jgi:hypothetical protein
MRETKLTLSSRAKKIVREANDLRSRRTCCLLSAYMLPAHSRSLHSPVDRLCRSTELRRDAASRRAMNEMELTLSSRAKKIVREANGLRSPGTCCLLAAYMLPAHSRSLHSPVDRLRRSTELRRDDRLRIQISNA